MTGRRGSVRHQVRLAAPADAVFGLVGDPARLPEWFPGIESCTVDGDQRTVTTRSGLPMPERILTVDPSLRRMQYRITAPMFVEHLGTVDVLDLGDGTCLAVYSTDAEPAALALVIGGAARAALASLPSVLGLSHPGDGGGPGAPMGGR
ncbi:MAG: SRPBCC family protein [Acidimicrobiales bacterium]